MNVQLFLRHSLQRAGRSVGNGISLTTEKLEQIILNRTAFKLTRVMLK